MFDAELQGEKTFLVVTQRPFEYEGEYGVVNLFSSLYPLLLEDGTPTTPADFPANGMVWWMVRPAGRGFAEPGRLLYATLEEARESGIPGKAWYQAQIDGIEPARPAKIVEIVKCADQLGLRGPRDRRRQPDAPAQPSADGEGLPELAGAPLRPAAHHGHRFRQRATGRSPSSPTMWTNTSTRSPSRRLEKVPADRRHEFKVKVSLDDRPVLENPEHTCTYQLVMAGDFAKFVEKDGTQLVLEGYDGLDPPPRQELPLPQEERRTSSSCSTSSPTRSTARRTPSRRRRRPGRQGARRPARADRRGRRRAGAGLDRLGRARAPAGAAARAGRARARRAEHGPAPGRDRPRGSSGSVPSWSRSSASGTSGGRSSSRRSRRPAARSKRCRPGCARSSIASARRSANVCGPRRRSWTASATC